MASAGAVGLVAVFLVDLLNLFYISRLGNSALTAAVGFTGAVGYFQISLSIGMTIGLGAVVSRAIGAGQFPAARRMASSGLVVMTGLMFLIGLATMAAILPILNGLGAHGEVRAQAAEYLVIAGPFLPFMALGMACSALLRSVGDARRSMTISLAGALVTALLDPLLILVLHMGLRGAVISTILSRLAMAVFGLRAVGRHGLLQKPDWQRMAQDSRHMGGVAMPAIMTNLATPVGSAYTTHAMAGFGLAAVAGQAITDRMVPVAFGFIFALTGAVGPIMAQNLGAGQVRRVRQTLRSSLLLTAACVMLVWIFLYFIQNELIRVFSATGVAADIVHLFCNWTAASFLFLAALFVANAAFNNLGFPVLATAFNWGRATLGTVPFVAWGVAYGPTGVLVGYALGGVLFGTLAMAAAFYVTHRLKPSQAGQGLAVNVPAATSKAALAEMAQGSVGGQLAADD
jgi:putative MATE family efflux protein